jgi:hypothetical protein
MLSIRVSGDVTPIPPLIFDGKQRDSFVRHIILLSCSNSLFSSIGTRPMYLKRG